MQAVTSRRTIAALIAVLGLAAAATGLAAERPKVEFLNSGTVSTGDLPFSEAVRHGDTLYLSGQIGIAPGTLKLVEGGFEAEARQTLENIRLVLAANGRAPTDILKCTVMLADMADWPKFNVIWRGFLKSPFPARSAFGATGLAFGARVEVECLASAGP